MSDERYAIAVNLLKEVEDLILENNITIHGVAENLHGVSDEPFSPMMQI